MLTTAGLINRSWGFLFDLLDRPLRALGSLGSLAVFAALTGVLMLWAYQRLSNQAAIRRCRKRIFGNLLGVRLFRDDLAVCFRLQRRLIGTTLRYASHSMKPLAILCIPMALALIQLDGRYGQRPFLPGETALLTVTVEDQAALPSVSLESVDAVIVETAPVRIPSRGEIVWRLRASQPGTHVVTVTAGHVTLTKQIMVGDRTGMVPGLRTSDWLDLIAHPGQAPITDGPVISIAVQHPAADVDVFGWQMHWLIPFFSLSLLTSFALKGAFHVEL